MVAGWSPRRTKIAAAVLLAVGLLARQREARADGALPLSLGILLPQDRPQQVTLATNFGMLISEDAGASWLWTCEQSPTTTSGYLYGLGPSPRNRTYALSPVSGLAYSDDGTCTWQRAGGVLATALASDYFIDRTDGNRVLAIAAGREPSGNLSPQSVYASSDGGATFADTALYTAPASTNVVGLEIAQSDPKVVYLAMYGYPGRHPSLARSADGGGTWETVDVEAALGGNEFRILAVDPEDANLVYLRVVAPTQEEVWTTRDGGRTFERVVEAANGQLQAFARLVSGTVLVGTSTNLPGGGSAGGGYRSVDGGHTFLPWTLCPQPHIVGLGERDGTLYIAGKNYSDGWALATSTDEGLTLTPLSTYDQVRGVAACAASTCAAACASEVMAAVWEGAVCSGELVDAGTYPSGPAAVACPDGGAGGGGSSGGAVGRASSGCGCGMGEGCPPANRAVVVMTLLVTLLAAGDARRRRSARSGRR
jgi:hypothetical protein